MGRIWFRVLPLLVILYITDSIALAQDDSQKPPTAMQCKTPTPTNPLEHNNRAVELGMQGQWPASFKEHELAVQGEPENDLFRRNMSGSRLMYGVQLSKDKKFSKAIDQYREALFADPNNAPAENGLNHCLEALGKNPKNLNYRLALAKEAEKKGSYRAAAVEYRICTHIKNSAEIKDHLGRCLVKAKDSSQGKEPGKQKSD